MDLRYFPNPFATNNGSSTRPGVGRQKYAVFRRQADERTTGHWTMAISAIV
jgi:hypothetical protein